jgi:hypothetical protein
MANKIVPLGHDGFNNRVKKISFGYLSVCENVGWCTSGF